MLKPVVSVKDVYKNYRVKKRHDGLLGVVQDIFSPRYVDQQALVGVSLEIRPGQCLGYLGPNGAGKSTLIKLLCGLLQPTAGNVEVLGYRPFKKERDFLSQIGVVFGHKSSLWWDLPVIESFDSCRVMYGIPRDRFRSNLDELCAAFALESILHKPARVLSLGERVKSEVAMNLLHEPRVLFLDEPTVGLDVRSKAELRSYIGRMTKERRLSVFLASHDMGDIESCCDRIIVTNRGRIEYQGDLAAVKMALKERYRNDLLLANADDDAQTLESLIVSYFRGSEKTL